VNSGKSIKNWPLPFAKPEEVGVSAERLAFIRPALQKYLVEHKSPNFVTLVARRGKIVHFETMGYADCETRKPVQTDTIFRMWSNSKPITGVAVMICVEDGLLALDDPVSKFIPVFKDTRVRIDEVEWMRLKNCPPPLTTPTIPTQREITLRDCLRNTTGLSMVSNAPIRYITEYPGVIQESGMVNAPEHQPDDIRKMVEALAKLPMVAQPGTQFTYQVGFPIIGLVIQMVTGKSLEKFYRERIFGPLGMKDTYFYLPKEKLDRFSTCYRPEEKGGKWKLVVQDRPEESERVNGPKTYFEAGGGRGGILTTIGDYARFAQMLLNGGELEGTRILGRKSVELMTRSHTGDVPVTNPGLDGYGFGLGVGVYLGGNPLVWRSPGAYGWTGAAGTSYFADPKEELICIIFTQNLLHRRMPDNNYQEKFEQLVYQALI
jgi:CubicO group peptidase (beta-lactamase class C family)